MPVAQDDCALDTQTALTPFAFDYHHSSFSVEPTSTVNDLDAGLRHVGDDVVVHEMVDDDVPFGEDRVHVHPVASHDLPHTGNGSASSRTSMGRISVFVGLHAQ